MPSLRAFVCATCLGLGTLLPTWAQDQGTVDSLRALLAHLPPDTTRLRPLAALAAALRERGTYDEAMRLLNEALSLARAAKDLRRQAGVLEQLGITQYYQGNSAAALTFWEPALLLLTARADTAGMNAVRIDMANAYLDLGRAEEAQHTLLDVLHWAERTGVRQEVMRCLVNLANIHALQGRVPEAQRYFLRVLSEYDPELGPFNKAVVLSNLGQTQVDLEQVVAAKATFQQLMAHARDHGQGGFIANACTGLGNAALLQGDRPTARSYFLEALARYREQEDADFMAILQERLAAVALKAIDANDRAFLEHAFQGDKARALAEAHQRLDSAIVAFKAMNDPDNLRGAYNTISEVESAQGDHKAALEHYRLFKAISDTLLNAERDKKLTERAMQYEFDKKQAAEAAEQRIKDEAHAYILQRERVRRNILIAAGLVAIVFGSISYRQRRRTQRALERSDELLLNILPEEVAEELKDTGAAQAKQFDAATILFTDFKGFTEASERMSPQELVEELNTCFKAFDGIITARGIEKIKTIGDAYMCAGGLPDPRSSTPADVVHAALEMQAFMHARKSARDAQGKPAFEMRVGVHTGPVVAGIVGVKKFQYDIWGDTVNTASRMESSGEVGRVNISGATHALVRMDSSLRFTARGKVLAKGKGELEMYFAERR